MKDATPPSFFADFDKMVSTVHYMQYFVEGDMYAIHNAVFTPVFVDSGIQTFK